MEQASQRLILPDLDATRALATRLARCLRSGDLVLLEGDLGAGKSEFARAVIRALAGAAITVPSPTFTILQTYELPGLDVGHADLYRINTAGELVELGLDECLTRGTLLVEWPERATDLWPAERLSIGLAAVPADPAARELTLRGTGRWAGLIATLADGRNPG
jgi:tRNA threonylcarbamoyl adenosine modification protein YjeE